MLTPTLPSLTRWISACSCRAQVQSINCECGGPIFLEAAHGKAALRHLALSPLPMTSSAKPSVPRFPMFPKQFNHGHVSRPIEQNDRDTRGVADAKGPGDPNHEPQPARGSAARLRAALKSLQERAENGSPEGNPPGAGAC
jgi:hypothetical protein